MPTRRELANAIRFLSMDAVQKANSGHPGMPMGMADIAQVLWCEFMHVNPANPSWANRDRFVLSNGHGAMLLYALLHLSGFDLSIEDLRQFRQLHSKTPGHPEVSETPGVETTTGPLGQGLANGVGMAIAEAHLAAIFNREHFNIVDHYTYVFVGDGCLMEGLSHEVCSLAGHLGLGKLIVFWDDNGISIDGDVKGWFTSDTAACFRAYHWQVIADVDGHDSDAIKIAIESARAERSKPTLICCKTAIGFGSPNLAGSEKAHGSPLGDAEIVGTRNQLNWPYKSFEIPDAIYNGWDLREKGQDNELLWNHLFTQYESHYPELAKEFLRRVQGWLPDNWGSQADAFIQATLTFHKPQATRKSSQQAINAYSALLPELLGGSADLTGSNCTNSSTCTALGPTFYAGNYIHYGVREFGMAGIMNGMALHGGIIPFGGTFLTFSDYARNALRLSALMKQRVIYVFTHDSIGLGEDGPTHQPIEHAASLRLIPNMHVWRPADLVETAVAWRAALERKIGPTSLLLSRQDLPQQTHDFNQTQDIAKGAYTILNHDKRLDGIIIATGSEVQLAVIAAKELQEENIYIRVVSMPCCELFLAQESSYREKVLPASVRLRVAIEAGVTSGWYRFVGDGGHVIGIDHFGLSAPAEAVFAECGLTVEKVKHVIKKLQQEKHDENSH